MSFNLLDFIGQHLGLTGALGPNLHDLLGLSNKPQDEELPPVQQPAPGVPIQQLPLAPTTQITPQGNPDDSPVPIVSQGQLPPRGPQPSNAVRFPDAPPAAVVTNGPTRDLGNRAMVEAAEAAEKNNPEHKGMFGVHGTLRNILGLLGDGLLVGAGRNAIYRPQTESEKAEDAFAGASEGGQQTLNAVERLAHAGDLKGAQELYQHYESDQYRQANLKSLDAARQSQIVHRGSQDFQTVLRTAANLAAEAGNDPGKRETAAARIQMLGTKYGIDPSQLGLNETMTDDDWHELARQSTGAYQGAQIDALPERLSIAERNAAANETRAGASVTSAGAADYRAHHPTGAGPRAQTELEAATEAFNTPPEKRTPAQNAVITHYTRGTRAPTALESIPGLGGSGTSASASAPRRFIVRGSRPIK